MRFSELWATLAVVAIFVALFRMPGWLTPPDDRAEGGRRYPHAPHRHQPDRWEW